jgi:ABC-type branched-subunit amino acid transport system ATPase component
MMSWTTAWSANYRTVNTQLGCKTQLSAGAKVKKPTLRGINLDVKRGGHVAVCGAVGSGKSTLLYSIMGEIPKVSGQVNITTSFIAMDPHDHVKLVY